MWIIKDMRNSYITLKKQCDKIIKYQLATTRELPAVDSYSIHGRPISVNYSSDGRIK